MPTDRSCIFAVLFLSMFCFGCSLQQTVISTESARPAGLPISGQAADGPAYRLLRAHEAEADAVVRVVFGYLWGREGFPRDQVLAGEWATQALYMMLDSKTAALLYGIVCQEIRPYAAAVIRALLAFAVDSPFARQLREAGIFDAAKCLAELPKPDIDEKKWIRELTNHLQRQRQYTAQYTATMSRLLTGKATAKEIRFLGSTKTTNVALFPSVLVALAEGHETLPELDLLRLITAQRGGNDLLRHPGAFLLRQRLLLDQGAVFHLLQSAHLGDVSAIRLTALHYEQGTSGFPANIGLARAWRMRGAFSGDSVCQITLALDALNEFRPHYASSRVWATLAKEKDRKSVV
jgi:hypothetical protein